MPVCLVLFLNGASYLTRQSNPSWAVKLNPFNTGARINYIVNELQGEPGKNEMDRLLTEARKTIRFAPGDARGFSATAEVLSRSGKTEKANQLFKKALQIGPTELHALLRRLQVALKNNDANEIALRTDVILRRWPLHIDSVFPVIATMIQNRNALPVITELISKNPPWRYQVIERLINSTSGLAFVQKTLLAQQAKKQPVNKRELDLTIKSLLKLGNFSQAHSMFILTLDEESREYLGYVFNSTFRQLNKVPVFGWNISSRPGAEVAIIQNEDSLGGKGLRVRFFDKPARLGNVHQIISLPTGAYKLTTQAGSSGLEIPKGLFWQVACTRGTQRGLLAKLNIESGTYKEKSISITFSVPDNGCPLQQLTLKTGINSDSWIDRYQGNVTFKHVTIQSIQ